MTEQIWQHKSTFILAAAGAAIGLGNIWKFPYMVGENGGAAFILIYLLCIALISLPLMIAESVVGRYAQKNAYDAILQVAQEARVSRAWASLPVFGMFALFLIFSFFSVIGGWSFAYAVKLFNGEFSALPIQEVGKRFGDFLADPNGLIFWHSLFALATAVIVFLGIIEGIERGLRYLMPVLTVLILFMLGYSVFFSGGLLPGLKFLFYPDFSQVGSETVLKALGQAFFTLNVGLCVVMAYAAYTPKNVSLFQSAVLVVVLDTVVALLMGIIIFPIVFAHNLDPAGGPGLLFVTMTSTFATMPFGNVIGGLFFSLVSVAALTSSISMLEGPVSVISHKLSRYKWLASRKVVVLIVASLGWLLGLLTVYSFNEWKTMTWLEKTAFDWIDVLTSTILMPLIGLGILIFVGWKMEDVSRRKELNALGHAPHYDFWLLMVRVISPLLVIVTFVYGVYEAFFHG